ncbi:hypothetical protein F5Y10DRAFT_254198 [Nemania abortiva]|nr:hypothetical protein F5Y10DRAFT_254198 [Nemania abortiva]
MATPERVLRFSGVYHRKEGVSEEEFHRFSRDHAIRSAKIHQKYGVLKYQVAYNSSSTQKLAQSLKFPYQINKHDLELEYYVKDPAVVHAIAKDEEFRALHEESMSYVNHETAKATLTWIEVYLQDGKMFNIGSEGESLYPSIAEMSNIEPSAEPLAKYHSP